MENQNKAQVIIKFFSKGLFNTFAIAVALFLFIFIIFTKYQAHFGVQTTPQSPQAHKEAEINSDSMIHLGAPENITSGQSEAISRIEKMTGAKINLIAKSDSEFVIFNLNGSQTYLSKNGTEMFVGKMYRTKDFFEYNSSINGALAIEEVKKLDPKYLTTYRARMGKIGELYVFTDPTCPYCGLLHSEIDTLRTKGIDVTYIPFARDLDPSISEPSSTSIAFANALCNGGSTEKMDELFNSEPSLDAVLDQGCEKSHEFVIDSLEIGIKSGVVGTPGLLFFDGKYAVQSSGYIPAEQLIKMYEKSDF
jgi:thiol:disulfide interchange protein DsbC